MQNQPHEPLRVGASSCDTGDRAVVAGPHFRGERRELHCSTRWDDVPPTHSYLGEVSVALVK